MEIMNKCEIIKAHYDKRKGANMEELVYEVKYPNLNVGQLVKDKKKFDYEMIEAYVLQCNKGFKVKEVGKTHRSGTIFRYEKLNNVEEIDQYKKSVIELIKKYNNQYGSQINIKDFSNKL